MGQFEGKIAVVTGGSRGIGAEIARQLAREGATVVLSYASRSSAAAEVVDEIRAAGGTAEAHQADLLVEGAGAAFIKAVGEKYGRIDVLVNNAGLFGFDGDAAAAAAMYRVNVLGLLEVTEAALPFLNAGANIVNLSSIVGRDPVPGGAAYSGTKAAVDAITKSHARTLGPKGIRVNAIAPGFTETEMSASGGPEFHQFALQSTPLGRTGQVADMAAGVLALAGPGASFITGEILGVGGGIRL